MTSVQSNRVPIITEGEGRGDYRCIPKVSKWLRDLLECNNQLRLWVISFSLKYDFDNYKVAGYNPRSLIGYNLVPIPPWEREPCLSAIT